MKEKDTLKGFIVHGVEFVNDKGGQAIGNCPFCDKSNHFYVNVKNRLWDCKRCSLHGNFNQFLEQISARNIKDLDEKAIKNLALDRKIPRSAFISDWEVGWDGQNYTLPVRNFKGMVEDLRRYRPGNKMQATSGASLGLLGAHHLHRHPTYPVYICEGEWDTIALVWLFRKLGHKGSVVGVPGASVFKNQWIGSFEGRVVNLMYDHDEAGENGRRLAFGKLKGIAKSVKWLEWPESLPGGFDVRDMIVAEAVKGKKPRFALRKLHKLLTDPFVEEGTEAKTAKTEGPFVGTGPLVPEDEVFEAYKKWLHLKDDEPLQILFGACFANRLQGDPIWLFLVAPPGGMKSELLMSISKHPSVEAKTSLTPHTLVSGFSGAGGMDPSLLPKLNGRILAIKDFTTILTMHYSSRDEIFGVLRDVYDGRTEKAFGTGVRRVYESHFGVLAGVTPKIEEFSVIHQSLGERFLKYRVGSGERLSEADKIRRALNNINQEIKMREELCAIANRVLDAKLPDKLPAVEARMMEWFVNLAQFCATLRGVVSRDRYTQHVMYKPATEIGTRLAKQIVKLAMGVSIYLRDESVKFSTYDLVRRVALDTVPDRVEEIVHQLWKTCTHPDDALKTAEVSAKTRLPQATVFRLLQDLELLKIVNRVGSGNKYEWRLHERVKKLIVGGRVYAPPKTASDAPAKPTNRRVLRRGK